MIGGKTVAVVVPAYNEEELIAETIAGIPELRRPDRRRRRRLARRDGRAGPRPSPSRASRWSSHERNSGVGAAIVTGYKRALAERMDVTVVMAGDNQMDPDELEAIAGPVSRGEVDYAKANRLISGRAWELIPHTRYLGNAVLSLLTKIASGYWHVADSQAGYTAISLGDARAARPRPHLHALRLPERPARAPERRQRARPRRPLAPDLRRRRALGDPAPQRRSADLVAARQGLLLADAREVRHPRLPSARLLLRARVPDDASRASALGSSRRSCASWATSITAGDVVLVALLLIAGSQFTLFAMWFDMESNKDLR